MPRSMRSNLRVGRLNERRCLHKENEVTALGKLINLSSEPSNIAFSTVSWKLPLRAWNIRHDRGSMRPVGFSRTGD